MLPTHSVAPDFELVDQHNQLHRLSDYQGKWVVLYFYPKDDTPGCTKEACGFRDRYEVLQQHNIEVIGISKDTVESHKKFAAKYRLNFPILADPDKTVIQTYQAWGVKKFMGKEFEGVKRITYIINPQGEIEHAIEKVNPINHAHDILKLITP